MSITDYPDGSTNANPLVLTDNSTDLQVTSGAATQSGVISESGGSFGLEKIGAGTLTLSANNTYSGTTTISEGTLEITASTLGTGSVVNNAELLIHAADPTFLANAISGTGHVTVTGTLGYAFFTANNSYTGGTTVEGGELWLGNSGTSGFITGNVIVGWHGFLNFNRSDDITFSGDISGLGSITQYGTGVLTLTGNNTYTFDTTVTKGVLAVASASNLGSGKIRIGAFGTLRLDASMTLTQNMRLNGGKIDTNGHDVTLTGVFDSGLTPAGVTKLGPGTLTLAGTGNYAGPTIISAGTLQVGNGGTAGSLGTYDNLNVINNSVLAFNRSDTISVANAISGNGALVQAGSGTLILTGANTYTGSTTISAGTLQIGNHGPSTLIQSNVLNNGILAFSNLDTFMLGAISGTGSVTILSGTTTFTANTSYTGGTTINSGATLEIGGTFGALTGNVVNEGTFAPIRQFDGAISGSGIVHIRSSIDPIVLGGISTYNGATQLDTNAKLAVTGSIANSTINLSAYTQLGGTGTVGATTAGSSSVLAPGVATGAIGTLSVAGNLTFATGAYSADIGPGSADKLQVSGVTTIAPNSGLGITVAANLTYAPGVYTLLSSAGNLNGQFSYVNYYGNFSSGIVPFITYDAHNVFLTLSQEKTWLGSPGNNLFTNTANWAGGAAPGSGETAVFGGSPIIAVNGPATIGAMRFTGGVPRYTFNITGAGGLTINNRGITDPFSSAPAFNVANGSSLTFTGFATSAGALIDVAQGGVLFYSGEGDPGTSRIDGPDGVLDVGGINRTTFFVNHLGTIGTINLGGKTISITGGVNVSANIVDNSVSNGSHPSAVRISGGGVRFTGTSTYTGGTTIESNGTLRLGNNGTIGAIVGDVVADGMLSFERSDTITYGGVVSGSGKLTQNGSGTTVLTGSSSFNGRIFVDSGTLTVNGNLQSAISTSVGIGAKLGGSGVVGGSSLGITIQGGGTLAPGDGIGTLQVNGNLNLASGANYAEELSPGAADQVTVNGNASIAGNLTARFSGNFGHQTYTILHAIGTLSGTFASISLTGLTPGTTAGVSYGAHDVYLTVTPMDAASADFGGDGKADMLWQKPDGTIVIWRTDHSGGVVSSTSVGVIDPAVRVISGVADYNGDGKADILLRDADGTVTEWLMNGGVIASSSNLGSMDSGWSVWGSGDVGGDGKADILWQKSDGAIVIWQMNSAGAIASSTNLGVLNPALWSLSNLADYNGDGKADVLLRNADGTVYDWLMNGAGIVGSNALGTMDGSWSVKGTGDFGGDGKADILWQKSDGTIVIWQMDGAGAVASSSNLGVLNPAVWSLSGVSDYNGDGKADVVLRNADGTVANWLMNGATIVFSNSLGTVASPVITPPPAVIDDFGGEGRADILWQKADGTAVLWQMSGTGTVSSSTDIGVVTSTPAGIGDFDGDGKADILVRAANGTPTIWLMNGAAVTGTNLLGPIDNSWKVKGIGDFDNDRRADIVWQRADGTVSLWLMNSSGGVVAGNLGVVTSSVIGVGDFNGDGKADLLLRDANGNVTDWLMNYAMVSASNNLGPMDSSWSVKGTGDFSSDGISDILWQKTDGTVVIWLMGSTGAVASGAVLGVLDPAVWSLAKVGDYNGDGKADVLLRNANGAVYDWIMNGTTIAGSNSLGTMDSSIAVVPAAPRRAVLKDFGGDGRADILWRKADGTPVLWQMNSSGTVSSSTDLGVTASTPIDIGDYDGDGKADILLRGAGGVVTNWLMNGSTVAGTNNLGAMDNSWSVKGSGDFDDAGTADILWQKSDGTMVIWQLDNSGAIASNTNLGIVTSSVLGVGDFNGDGMADILLRDANGTVTGRLMNGTATLASNNLGPVDSSWSVKGTGDFSGDGISDILWQKTDGTVVIWLMGSTGTVASGANLGVLNPAVWSLSGVADYNGDGKADILLRNANGAVYDWIMNGTTIAGSNSLGTMDSSIAVVPAAPRRAVLKDFGGDGRADILWRKADGTVALWEMNGTGTAVATTTSLGVVTPTLVGHGDFDGDGRTDVLLRDAGGAVTDWLMNGASVAGSNNLGTMDNSWSVKGTGDFGRDGTADILWQKSDGTVVIWQMNGAGAIASSTNLGTVSTAAWALGSVADYNGDGKADVLLRNSNGAVYDWLMDGAGIAGSNFLGTMDSSWHLMGTGDFGGDGTSDLLWHNSNGTVVIWQMDSAGTVASNTNLGVVNPAVWSFAAVADYNGDGKADILLRNTSGSVDSWLMNGTAITGSSALGTMNNLWSVITR